MLNRTQDFEGLIKVNVKKKYQKEVLSKLKELREFKPNSCDHYTEDGYMIFENWDSGERRRFNYGHYIFKNNPNKYTTIRNFMSYIFGAEYFEI